MPILTIFTPAYNRAHLLPRLYESLVKQTNKNFTWLIIDDGSKDATKEIVTSFIHERKLDIKYVYQDNQGMHGAHNTAYKNVTTELNTCIDSDDYMPTNAVELILNKWESTKNKHKYSGIIGLDSDMDGNIIGSKFNTKATTLEDFYLKGGKGDKKMVYRTDIINKYPEYPLFEGEKYVGLGYKYLLADKEYKLVTINEVLVIVDYQIGGSSNNMYKQYVKNPKGFSFLRKQKMIHSKSFKARLKHAIHYVSSSLLSGNTKFISESPKPLLTTLVTPLGIILFFWIKNQTKKEISSNEL